MFAAREGTTRRGWWRLLVSALSALLLVGFISGPTGPPSALAADTEPKPVEPADPALQRAENVIAAARQYLGVAYRVGSEGPTQFDCSGLVFRAFSDASLVDRISGNRLRAAGYMRWFGRQGLMTANEEEAQRGDLVIYDRGRHIGIYLGEGKTISALLTGVAVHSLHGINQDVTGFLRPDWSGDGEVAPFVPVELPDVLEEPAVLVPASDWVGAMATADVQPIARDGAERVDLRTASSRTFENGDGTFTTEFQAQPIHYLAPDSDSFEPIDLRFEVNDRQDFPTVTRSPVRVAALPANDSAGMLIASAGDQSIAVALADVVNTTAQPTLIDDGRVVDYLDLLPDGVGLRVTAQADGFRSFLVLTREPDTNRFTFAIDAPGLTAMLNEMGDVLLTDETGAVVARIPRPVLLDSSDSDGMGGGLSSAGASFELTVSDGQIRLTLVARSRLLAEAAYPAYLDLALTGFAGAAPAADLAFVSSRHPDSALHGFARPEAAGGAELMFGRQPRTKHESRALLRFNELRSTLGTVDVAAASLELLPYVQRDEQVAALVSRLDGAWDATSLTWNTKPAVGDEVGSVLGASGAWLGIDVSAYAADVLSNGAADSGLVLHGEEGAPGTWKRIMLGEMGPRLVVIWSGLRPTALAEEGPKVPDQVAPEDLPEPPLDFGWGVPSLAGAQVAYQLQVSDDGFATVELDTGRVKRKAGKASEWSLPTDTLTSSDGYEWRVRVRTELFGWTDWSVPQSIQVSGLSVDTASDSEVSTPTREAPVL